MKYKVNDRSAYEDYLRTELELSHDDRDVENFVISEMVERDMSDKIDYVYFRLRCKELDEHFAQVLNNYKKN